MLLYYIKNKSPKIKSVHILLLYAINPKFSYIKIEKKNWQKPTLSENL